MSKIIPAHILASAFISLFAASASFAGDADTAVGGGVGAVKQRAKLSRLGVETASNSFHLGM